MILTPNLMHSLTELPVYVSAEALKLVDHRIPGGYMNRWLVREVKLVPAIIVTTYAVYVHPERWVAFVEATQ